MEVSPTIADAVAALRRGELVGMPTETVYGLAGDASNPDAVRRIFALKGRPADHPLIVHIEGEAMLSRWAEPVPESARTLARAFWPGPLTMILRKAAAVPTLVTGGQETIGLRSPAHPLARALLAAFGGGLAAPSANRFGHVSPTTARHVREEFGDALPVVLDGGACEVGIESTIVDLSGATPRVLRPGAIEVASIEAALGSPIGHGATRESPRASGTLASHYAPRTPAERVARSALEARIAQLRVQREGVYVLALGELPEGVAGRALPADPRGYARALYAALREADAAGVARILIEAVPSDAAWAAIADRLARATREGGPHEAT